MATQLPSQHQATIDAAVEAVRLGYQPIPIYSGKKNPGVSTWTRLRWDASDLDKVREQFTEWVEGDMTNVGLLLGEPSGNLVDVDLDHPKAWRLRDHLLPPTPMRTGRAGRRSSHYWYVAEEGTSSGTRRHKMPDRSTSIELRATGAQTLVPPSIHPTGEEYLWEGEPWGGEAGPARVNGRVLATQVALIALAAVLLENWPGQGGRHDAYLALAGGLLRYGEGVHPYWQRNAGLLLRTIADVTHDEEGPDAREREAMDSTLAKLQAGTGNIVGFPRLAEIIGEEHVRQVRRLVREVESSAGFERDASVSSAVDLSDSDDGDLEEVLSAHASEVEGVDPEERDPLNERMASWQSVDLDPYLRGEVSRAEPTIFRRTDAQALMYQGRVNMLYGSSETAKSWLALYVCLQEIGIGERAIYLDFEDEPAETVGRLLDLGTLKPGTYEDIKTSFTYIHPEEPMALMQRNRWGKEEATETGRLNMELFAKELDQADPSLIVVDGMSVLYGLHGLDTNDTSSTDVITGWLKKLTRNGRTTVIIIDHSPKAAKKGSLPIGSQHKVSMVMGTLIQVWPLSQPMPGALGELDLVVLKDRPGQVRQISQRPSNDSKAQVCARVEIDSRIPDNGTELKVLPPAKGRELLDDDQEVDLSESVAVARLELQDHRCQQVLDAFGGDVDVTLSVAEIRDQVSMADKTVRKTCDVLVDQGELEPAPSKPGGRPGVRYRLAVGGGE